MAPDDRAIVSYLVADWRKVFHLTTVDQAEETLGLAPDVVHRRRIGDYLRHHPEVSPIVRRWGALALTLTEHEKLLGRLLVIGEGPLGETELRDRLQIGEHDTREGLESLLYFRLIDRVAGYYRPSAGWREQLGPLGWSFHRVEVTGERPFNVP